MSRVRNDLFDSRDGFNRGRSVWVFASWQLIKWFFFKTVFPWPSSVKCQLLRLYGAKIGRGVCIKPQVNIHMPWKLVVGDHVWIGEEVFLLNFEPIRLESHSCISQRAFLCTGNHDFRDPAMRYRNRPILVEAGAWVGAQVFVAPGVIVGKESIITVGSVLLRDAVTGAIYSGNPAVKIGNRFKENKQQ